MDLEFKYGMLQRRTPIIELTTMIGCPLLCNFCPQKNLKTNYNSGEKYLSHSNLEIFLNKLPKNTIIHFSGMSEPWANPNCTDFLEFTLRAGFKVAIYTTLYNMKRHDVERIKSLMNEYEHSITHFCIHLPDINNNMRGWKFSEDWKYAYENLSSLKISCGVTSMTMDESSNVHPDVLSFVTVTNKFDPHTRAGALDLQQIADQKVKNPPAHFSPITCASTPFYDHNVLLPNGDVVLCCMDYNLQHILGNLLEESYFDILNGKKLMLLIEMNEQEEFSKCSLCKSCENVMKLKDYGGIKLAPSGKIKHSLKNIF